MLEFDYYCITGIFIFVFNKSLVQTYVYFIEEYNRLHRLAQSHLICQDTVLSRVPVEEKPVHPLQLIATKLIPVSVLLTLFERLEEGRGWAWLELELVVGWDHLEFVEFSYGLRVCVLLKLPGCLLVGKGSPFDQVVCNYITIRLSLVMKCSTKCK